MFNGCWPLATLAMAQSLHLEIVCHHKLMYSTKVVHHMTKLLVQVLNISFLLLHVFPHLFVCHES